MQISGIEASKLCEILYCVYKCMILKDTVLWSLRYTWNILEGNAVDFRDVPSIECCCYDNDMWELCMYVCMSVKIWSYSALHLHVYKRNSEVFCPGKEFRHVIIWKTIQQDIEKLYMIKLQQHSWNLQFTTDFVNCNKIYLIQTSFVLILHVLVSQR